MKFWGRLVILVLIFTGLSPVSSSGATTLETSIQTKLQTYLSRVSPTYKVSLRSVSGSQNFHVGIGEHDLVEPASVFKLYYAYATLLKEDRNQLSLTTTIHPGYTYAKCLKLLITISNNECAKYLRDALGYPWLNELFQTNGWSETRIITDDVGNYVTKQTSAANTADLLYQLANGTLLSAENNNYFRSLLRAQIFRHRITAGVKAGVRVENKGGEYWIASGWTRSDAAIVFDPTQTYVMVVYGSRNASNSHEAAMSKIVYGEITGQSNFAVNTFPKQQFVTNIAVWVHRNTPTGRKLYVLKKNTKVEVVLSQDDSVWINVAGKRSGFIKFQYLTIRPQYVWPNT